MQQNIPNIALSALAQPFAPHASDANNTALPFNLDPFTAKQMAALQATSLAKAVNRSAPGSAPGGTSASYIGGAGGMSLNQSNRPDAPHDRDPFAPLPDLQASNQSMNQQQHQQQHQQQQQQQQPNNAAMQQEILKRRRSWLNNLATLMTQHGVPLPPQLTGVPLPPNYDPANMPWKSLEVSPTDHGVIRLGGKDVDLFRLWSVVTAQGGLQVISQRGLWQAVRQQLNLPEVVPSPGVPGDTQPTVAVLERYYAALLRPLEDAYRKNMMEHSQRAMAARMPGQPGPINPQARPPSGVVGMPQNAVPGGNAAAGMLTQSASAQVIDGPLPGQFLPTQVPLMPPSGIGAGAGNTTNGANVPAINGANGVSMPKITPGFPAMPGAPQNGSADLDLDVESRKRKMQEVNESEAKRVRQKTGGSDVSDSRASVAPGAVADSPAAPTVTRTLRQPSRRKIEYVPLAPELETSGGRNLDLIQNEWARMASRPLRHSDEWGHVDIDALTLSLRSRISTELSYSLTTFALLTLARNHHPQQHPRDRERESGFPIAQAPDLLDEAIDLVEDIAFTGIEDVGSLEDDYPILTHKELMNVLLEDGSQPFAALQPGPGAKDPNHGPRQRPAEIVLTVVNIIRNISQGDESSSIYLARHDKLVHVMLRLCSLAPRDGKSSTPVPLSPILSLSDLLVIRKDVVHMLVNFGAFVNLSPGPIPSKQMQLAIRRAYEVMASFLIDPSETISPFQYVLQMGIQTAPHNAKPPAPPSLANQALEAFARFTLPDDNRRAVGQTVAKEWVWTLFESLVHRLPVTDHDFHAIMREPWIGYVERLVLCLYSLAFLSPPEIKDRIKRNATLGFSKVVLRLLRKLALHTPIESRQMFAWLIRRAIELLKVVDDAADSFDPSRSAMPTLTFGVGYGEHGDNRVERGLGMLCAYQEDVILGLMMHPEVVDPMLFSELESLVRVGG